VCVAVPSPLFLRLCYFAHNICPAAKAKQIKTNQSLSCYHEVPSRRSHLAYRRPDGASRPTTRGTPNHYQGLGLSVLLNNNSTNK
jgi:hypothetical protein